MNVRGVGHAGAMERFHSRDDGTANVQQPPDGTEVPTTDEAPDQQAPPGVLRLLAAGHFRGVADVRLRINFADQLPSDLPPLSQPTGNGTAYAKFLAVYNGLNATEQPAGDVPAEPSDVPTEETPPPETGADATTV